MVKWNMKHRHEFLVTGLCTSYRILNKLQDVNFMARLQISDNILWTKHSCHAQWRTQKIFMGGFYQWHMVVIWIWCSLFVTSQFDVMFLFQNQRFGKVCWHNTYASQLWCNFRKSCMQRLGVAYDFGCRALYNLPRRASDSSHQVQCNIPTFEALLRKYT